MLEKDWMVSAKERMSTEDSNGPRTEPRETLQISEGVEKHLSDLEVQKTTLKLWNLNGEK